MLAASSMQLAGRIELDRTHKMQVVRVEQVGNRKQLLPIRARLVTRASSYTQTGQI